MMFAAAICFVVGDLAFGHDSSPRGELILVRFPTTNASFQTILAKQQRDVAANAINTDIGRQAAVADNMAQVTGTITNSLQNFRMP
jgi:hypothetical protein